jgi:hypothetical protein
VERNLTNLLRARRAAQPDDQLGGGGSPGPYCVLRPSEDARADSSTAYVLMTLRDAVSAYSEAKPYVSESVGRRFDPYPAHQKEAPHAGGFLFSTFIE